ncbi:class I SAM-dependent methyltransferase [Marinicella meishanensis]|uniref:class I SAM-dependent methyltransferase n=1 Tax=Marinicella meishanensis TaxID=2873263 RepID=UPI001CBF1264
MNHEQKTTAHYRHGHLLAAIEQALAEMGLTPATVAIEDLAPVDEFHIGGREATQHLFNNLRMTAEQRILDVGCGLGGAARFAAQQFNVQVTGIDLCEEYVQVGSALNHWVGLNQQVDLIQGSATDMPFEDATYSGAYQLHVGMNIEHKVALFQEVSRVLKSGASFGVYDIMRCDAGELTYPVPWASTAETSHLASAETYKQALEAAGLRVIREENRRAFALDFFARVQAQHDTQGGPPPLGLHVLMQQTTPIKIGNMVNNLKAGFIAPVQLVAIKQ